MTTWPEKDCLLHFLLSTFSKKTFFASVVHAASLLVAQEIPTIDGRGLGLFFFLITLPSKSWKRWQRSLLRRVEAKRKKEKEKLGWVGTE